MEISIKDIVLKNRAYLIGLAMVLVLTYHQLNIGLGMGIATPLFRTSGLFCRYLLLSICFMGEFFLQEE